MSILGIVSLVPKASLLMIQPTESQDHDIFHMKKNRNDYGRKDGPQVFGFDKLLCSVRKMVAIFYYLFISTSTINPSLSIYNAVVVI